MIDLTPFVDAVRALIARHTLGATGEVARWTRPGNGEHGKPRELGPNPYGAADAANLLYTIGELPADAATRRAWIEALQAWQDPATGAFHESTHHPIHTTAHCLGALELFDAKPRHPLRELAPLVRPAAIAAFLDGLDWAGAPWTEAHRGAGVYAALVLAGAADRGFEDAYFGWLAAEVDPETGLLRRGCVDPSPAGGAFPHLAGSFHYLFNFEHARRAWPHPEALIDTCLAIRANGSFPLAKLVWFADVDWVYCLSRSLRRTSHRADEARAALLRFAEEYAHFALSLDPETDDGLDDLHRLFGVTCALAELQQAVPDTLWTERPLRLVLDRRPFI